MKTTVQDLATASYCAGLDYDNAVSRLRGLVAVGADDDVIASQEARCAEFQVKHGRAKVALYNAEANKGRAS